MCYHELNQDYSSRKVADAKITDLSPEGIVELRGLLSKSGRFERVDLENLSDQQLLIDLQLIQDGQITIAAMVLLAKPESQQKFLPYNEIRYNYRLSSSENRAQDIVIYSGGYILYYNKL